MAVRCGSCDAVLTDGEAIGGYCPLCRQPLDGGESAVEIQCPVCGRPSRRIKCYRLGLLVNLCVFAFTSTWDEVGCPSCIRGKIVKYCLLNVPTANLVWPLIVLPWSVVLWLRSMSKGHSRKVREAVR